MGNTFVSVVRFGAATQRITVDNPGASSTGWTLTLSPGNYEICVEHILPSSQVLADDTTQEMLVSAYTTGTPSVNSVNWIGGQPIITGWYDAENTVYLRVFVVDRWYVLGQDSQLTVNGNSWKLNLSQLDPVLKVGSYTVVVQAASRDGTVFASDSSSNLIISPLSNKQVFANP